jgi:hypothetical protein
VRGIEQCFSNFFHHILWPVEPEAFADDPIMDENVQMKTITMLLLAHTPNTYNERKYKGDNAFSDRSGVQSSVELSYVRMTPRAPPGAL